LTNSLNQSEILRGFGVFEEVLSDSKKFHHNSLIAYLNYSDELAGLPVKVGFLLSKKKLKKRITGTGSAVC